MRITPTEGEKPVYAVGHLALGYSTGKATARAKPQVHNSPKKEQREKYVATLNKMIEQMENIVNSTRTKTIHRLRAMNVLSALQPHSYANTRIKQKSIRLQ